MRWLTRWLWRLLLIAVAVERICRGDVDAALEMTADAAE